MSDQSISSLPSNPSALESSDPANPGAGGPAADHRQHAVAPPPGAATRWIHPPIAAGLAMMPAEMRLPLPAASPFLPVAARATPVPDVRPREVVRLKDGDTVTTKSSEQ